MNEQFWWYVARSTGLVAWALATASVLWGLLLSTKALGRRPRPAWLLDLHRHLGGLTLVFTAVHLLGLAADSYVHFGWADLFVPMASSWQPAAVTWGIVAFYLLVVVEASSLAMRRLPRRLWRGVHLLSYAVFVLATVHGVTAGTDWRHPATHWGALLGILAVTFFLVYRMLAVRRRRRRTPAATPTTPARAPAGV